MKKPVEAKIYVRTTEDQTMSYSGGRYFHVVLTPVIKTSDQFGVTDDRIYSDMIAQSQSCSNDAGGSYAWEIRYQDVYCIDEHRAKQMYQTLKSINSKMDVMDKKFGRPSTFGQYALRFAHALGADRFVFPDENNEMKKEIFDFPTAAHKIDLYITNFFEKYNPKLEPQETEVV